MQVTLVRYFFLSFVAVIGAVYYAYNKHEQFYPTVIYLTNNKICVLNLGNFAMAIALSFAKIFVSLLFKNVEDDEANEVLQNAKYAIVEVAISLTSFRSDMISVTAVGLFVILLADKVMHWLSKLRMENLARSVPMSISACRLLSGLLLLLCFDLFFGCALAYSIYLNGFSVLVLFAFEFLILAVSMFEEICRFGVITVDRRRGGRWDSKPTVMFVIQATHDLMHLVLYVAFTVFVTKHWSFPLYLLREVFLAVRQLQSRVVKFIAYRALVKVFDSQFATLTAEQITASGRDLRCVICFEDMTHGKELPCRHVFHMNCLKRWFEQKQECPLCRKKVVPSAAHVIAQRERARQLQIADAPPLDAAAQQQAADAQGQGLAAVGDAQRGQGQGGVAVNAAAVVGGGGVQPHVEHGQGQVVGVGMAAAAGGRVRPDQVQVGVSDASGGTTMPVLSSTLQSTSGGMTVPMPLSAAQQLLGALNVGTANGLSFGSGMVAPPPFSPMGSMQKLSIEEMKREAETATVKAQMTMEFHQMCVRNAQFELDNLISLQMRWAQIHGFEKVKAAKSEIVLQNEEVAEEKSDTLMSAAMESGTDDVLANETADVGILAEATPIDSALSEEKRRESLPPEKRELLEKRLRSFSHLERSKGDEKPKDQ